MHSCSDLPVQCRGHPLSKSPSRKPRKTISAKPMGTWLSRGSNGVYVAVTGSANRSFPALTRQNLCEGVNVAYTGWPPKTGTVDFLGLCSDEQLSFFTLLDRASFPQYNNTKIIKFGWELFILWVISYGLSFSGFAIHLSLIMPRNSGNRANLENDSP